MICSIDGCGRQTRAYGWCGMHYARNARNGGPMVKLRASGVLDAPVPQRKEQRKGLGLGHTQVRVMRELAAGEIVTYERLEAAIGGQSQNALQQVVSSLRLKFGWDVIETHTGRGYSAGPILRRMLE